MYRTSAYFIKDQIPGISVSDLLQFYKQELEEQGVSRSHIVDHVLHFSNDIMKYVANPFANRFFSFQSGAIRIEERGADYVVTLEADESRIFTMGGITGGAISLIFLAGSGFDLFSIVIGLIVFLLFSAIGYIKMILMFPVYFTSVRNEIEWLVQQNSMHYR